MFAWLREHTMTERQKARRARALVRFSMRSRTPNETDKDYTAYVARKDAELVALGGTR